MPKAKTKKDELFEELTTQLKGVSLFTAAALKEEQLKYAHRKIPTGCPTLDLLTGGGYPIGLVTEIAGKKASGKSTMALLACAQAQKMGGKVLYIDAELTLSDPEQIDRAQHMGVDIDQLYIIHPRSVEDGMQAIRKTLEYVEKTYEDDVPFVLIIWDTIAFTPFEHELESFKLGKDTADMGKRAQKLRYYMRELITLVYNTRACLINISHLTTNIGAGYGGPTDTIPGGSAFQHGASMQIIMRASNAKDNRLSDQDDNFYGNLVSFKLEKTRLSPPRREVTGWLNVYSGIEQAPTVLDYLLNRKHLIKDEGRKITIPAPEGMAPVEITTGDVGREKFKEAYDASPELQKYLYDLMFADYQSVMPWNAPLVLE